METGRRHDDSKDPPVVSFDLEELKIQKGVDLHTGICEWPLAPSMSMTSGSTTPSNRSRTKLTILTWNEGL